MGLKNHPALILLGPLLKSCTLLLKMCTDLLWALVKIKAGDSAPSYLCGMGPE